MGRKVILDVDTGTDDAVAIMFAALHPDLDLIGVTTVTGNLPIEYTTDNTLRVLDWIGRPDVPVYRGLSQPIARRGRLAEIHAARDSPQDGHGNSLPIPPTELAQQQVGAVEYLVETLRSTTEQLTLVAVGPLSNIATALAIVPSLVEAVQELVVMGGSHAIGNVTASAEFNIWVDPEAANVVLSAGFEHLTLVPLDATHQALFTRGNCAEFERLGTPAGVAAARFIGRRLDAEARTTTATATPVHDVMCPAYLVRPEVITTRHLHVVVDTASPLTVGRTVMDLRPDTTVVPNAHVALQADGAALLDVLMETFAREAT
ncbi:MAG TPA: nucleoside hydrolase [Jiangellaceae bacterium]|nr:nucleoside hydrolase [Jiangellaceae bacterium]